MTVLFNYAPNSPKPIPSANQFVHHTRFAAINAMKMDLNEIIQLAIEFAGAECGQSVIITDTLFPDQFPGADLDGWALFVAMPESGDGDPMFVGVHTETGETKIFDPEADNKPA